MLWSIPRDSCHLWFLATVADLCPLLPCPPSTCSHTQAESFNPRCLFLFGSYTIGKERLFLYVAQALRAKVYMAASKRSVMGCIDLPPEHAQLLTSNHLEANIHVVRPQGLVTVLKATGNFPVSCALQFLCHASMGNASGHRCAAPHKPT